MYQNDHETPVPPNTTRKREGTRNQPNYKPVRSYGKPEDPSLGSLFQQIWNRMRPSLASLKYRYAVLADKKNLIRLGILVLAGYYVLSSDKGFFISSKEDGYEGASIFDDGSPGKPKKARYKSTNEAAPVSASELYDQEAKAYIDEYAKVAQKEQAEFGVLASISLAQGLVESRAGTSKLAKNNNNHFGIKCFSRHCRKGHCSNFTDDTHKDFFRKYTNPVDSWRDHSRLLSKGRYARLKRHGSNYREWAYGLKSIGYATDRTYAEKLVGVIEKYDLHRFDR